MKSYVVIGVGRFGTAVATELASLGHEVLAVDENADQVQAIADKVTHAVVGDAKDPAVLKALGVRNFDCAVVAAAYDVGDSALIAMNLKEMGVKEVIAKASSHVHRKVLEKIGVDMVVFPEHEMGLKVAQRLSSAKVLNFVDLADNYGIVEFAIPKAWEDRSILELNVRAKYGVNIVAVKTAEGRMDVAPGAGYTLRAGDAVMVLGDDENISRLHDL